MKAPEEWKQVKADIFWGEIAPCDHVIQIYENDGVFLDTLAGFVGGGINANECVIVIAVSNHLEALHLRLASYGINIQSLIAEERYIPLDAEKVLDTFMVDGWPDENLFNNAITFFIEKGICKGRRIRAFGEMVAILWGKGFNGATVQLEHLWNKFCAGHNMSLFCAYPKVGFTENINDSIKNICDCHSKIINGAEKQLTEIFYTDVKKKAS
jgi:hypothetical protein